MRSITKKGEVLSELAPCLEAYENKGPQGFVNELDHRLLLAKIRFPLLETCAGEIFNTINSSHHIEICDRIAELRRVGGYVIIGIILQKRLPEHFEESMQKAAEYIEGGNEWYVTDIIGERVFGVSLLRDADKTLQRLEQLSHHESSWVVRSIGPGAHYAIKKGLGKKWVEKVFELLLSLGQTKDTEVKKGIGWAAKTTAKFHPDIIEKYSKAIYDSSKTGPWFRTKVKIGLERNAYAKRNRSKNHSQ